MKLLADSYSFAHLKFDSYLEAIEFADKTKSRDVMGWSTRRGDYSFYKTSSFEEALKLARFGWKEGKELVDKFLKNITLVSRVHQPEIYFTEIGNGGFDIGRVLSGEPECMMDYRESETLKESPNGPIIKLVVNMSMAAGVNTDSAARRGAAIIGLVDSLEASGKRVEIVLAKINGSGEGTFMIEIPLKASDSPLDIDTIAFALAHASMNRRFGFALSASCGKLGLNATKGSYGSNSSYKPECDIYIPRMDSESGWTNDKDAKDWLEKKLVDLGIELD